MGKIEQESLMFFDTSEFAVINGGKTMFLCMYLRASVRDPEE